MNKQFAQDVKDGLGATQKSIPYIYFYDERGSWLFQQIMQLPEYYLTDCEICILETYKDKMLEFFGAPKQRFNLIDLGAGDASKTKSLLQHYSEKGVNFTYTPVDLSTSILSALSESLDAAYPNLKHRAINKDYWEAMEQLKEENTDKKERKVVLFLGANIGNFTYDESVEFLTTLKTYLNPGDLVLVGFDLKKRPEIIYKAYLDSKGITAAFNLNLLHRINQELGANFKPNYFRFYPYYNPQTGELRSHLVSQKEQSIHIEALNMEVKFEQWEAIHTEISKKHTLKEIEDLATAAGYTVKQHFLDNKAYFVDTLLEL
ncbi:L-histidine N(alpha)-methyltransferase [Aureispira anguillae]|uniref:L-histidine N(Alpha)-methyltransferase n=1 Tax=Aureispira anguillae TaxID=2864201 RepID=A0A916DV68_9BACT|nr:L-histidine N(alpha)-methyltransferase [Aureispira anguillae]BDS13422.1 L-histidine N(alpha)-methyltransferase [Aureispira anguillae]